MAKREMTEAQRRELQINMLKSFLLRAEAFGWVNRSGGTRFLFGARVWEFWQGAKNAISITLSAAEFSPDVDRIFDHHFFKKMMDGDVIRVCRAEHQRLCDQPHQDRLMNAAPGAYGRRILQPRSARPVTKREPKPARSLGDYR